MGMGHGSWNRPLTNIDIDGNILNWAASFRTANLAQHDKILETRTPMISDFQARPKQRVIIWVFRTTLKLQRFKLSPQSIFFKLALF